MVPNPPDYLLPGQRVLYNVHTYLILFFKYEFTTVEKCAQIIIIFCFFFKLSTLVNN